MTVEPIEASTDFPAETTRISRLCGTPVRYILFCSALMAAGGFGLAAIYSLIG